MFQILKLLNGPNTQELRDIGEEVHLEIVDRPIHEAVNPDST
jgi:hypothetical protein